LDFLLVLNGCVILVLSQAVGYAFLWAIRRQPAPAAGERAVATVATVPTVERWRMSHAATSAGALFLLVLGPIAPHLRLGPAAARWLDALLIVSTYGLCLGTVVAGFSGQRGTQLGRPWPNLLTYALYVIGAVGSTAAGGLLLYGAGRAYAAAP
jgi:hypothetical protein